MALSGKSKLLHILRILFISGLAYVVNYGITLVLTPYITRTVGAEAYGFVTMAKEFAQYTTILTMALNTYAARYIGLAYHRGDKREANVYFSSVFWGNLFLAFCILGIVLVGIYFLESLLVIPSALVTDIKLLFLFTFISFSVSTVFSVFSCAGYVCDRMDLPGIFKTISYIVNAAVLIVAFGVFPEHVYYVGIGTLATTLVVAVSDFCISRHFLPDLTTDRRYFSLSAVKRLVLDGFWASFNMVGNLLNNGLDLIVCNKMLSALAMGQLAIAKSINTILQGFYYIVDQAFIPMFLKSYADNDRDTLLVQLKMSMKVNGLLANATFAGFAALGLAFYRLWIPEQDTELVYWLTMVTISTSIPNGAVHPLYYIYTLTVKRKFPCYVTIAGGVLNVIGMYVLIKYVGIGVFAVAWTTVVVMCVINFVTNPLYMAHVLKLPYSTFYPDIFRNVLSCAVLTAFYCGLAALYTPQSWIMLILCVIAYALAGVPLHFAIACDKKQKRLLLQAVKNMIKR